MANDVWSRLLGVADPEVPPLAHVTMWGYMEGLDATLFTDEQAREAMKLREGSEGDIDMAVLLQLVRPLQEIIDPAMRAMGFQFGAQMLAHAAFDPDSVYRDLSEMVDLYSEYRDLANNP